MAAGAARIFLMCAHLCCASALLLCACVGPGLGLDRRLLSPLDPAPTMSCLVWPGDGQHVGQLPSMRQGQSLKGHPYGTPPCWERRDHNSCDRTHMERETRLSGNLQRCMCAAAEPSTGPVAQQTLAVYAGHSQGGSHLSETPSHTQPRPAGLRVPSRCPFLREGPILFISTFSG